IVTRALSCAVSAAASISSTVNARWPTDSLPRVRVISPDALSVLKANWTACALRATSRPESAAPSAAVSVHDTTSADSTFRILKSLRPVRKRQQQEREDEQIAQHGQHETDRRQAAERPHRNERRYQQHAEADHDDDARRDHRRADMMERRGERTVAHS